VCFVFFRFGVINDDDDDDDDIKWPLWRDAVSPAVYRPPRDTEAPSGSTVSFDCFVSGEPRPTVRWQRVGEPVVLTTSEKHDVTHDGSVLVIRDVNFRDSGDYECVAENMAGSTRAIARLTVWGQSHVSVLISDVVSSTDWHSSAQTQQDAFLLCQQLQWIWLGRSEWASMHNATFDT